MRISIKLILAAICLLLLNACNDSKNTEKETKENQTSEEENDTTDINSQVIDLDYEVIEVLDDEGNLVYNEDGTIKRDTIFFTKRPEIDTSKYALFSVLDINTGDESFIVHNKLKTDTKLINTPCECSESLTELLENIIKPTTNDPNLSAPKEMIQAYRHYYDYILNHCKNELGFQKNDWKDCENSENLSQLTEQFNQILNTGYYLVNKVDDNGKVILGEGGAAVKDTVVFED